MSTLARTLSRELELPLHEVDEVQFGPNWERVDSGRVAAHFAAVQATPRWVVDGFGLWDCIERRLGRCDDFVFVDFSLARHFWWAGKSQVRLLRGERAVGGRAAPPRVWLLRAMLFVHRELRPKMLPLAKTATCRVHHLRSPGEVTAMQRGRRSS